jgi:hypothetical protein
VRGYGRKWKSERNNLVSSGGATVDLDLGNVALLLAERQLVHLGVDDDTDDRGVLVDLVDLSSASGLALWGAKSGSVVGESLALLVEALVEAALERVRQVLSPHGGEGAEAAGGLDVSNDTDGNDRGSLNDGDGLDDLLLVGLGASSVQLTDDVGHSSLEGEESREVYRLALFTRVRADNGTMRMNEEERKSDSQERGIRIGKTYLPKTLSRNNLFLINLSYRTRSTTSEAEHKPTGPWGRP